MKYIKASLSLVVFLFSFIFPPIFFTFLRKVIDNLYSLYKKNELGKVGLNLHLHFPCYLRGGQYIFIGDNFYCDKRTRIEAWDEHLNYKFNPKITIGNNVSINSDCHIGAISHINIGDNVLIGSKVFITDHSHGNNQKSEINIPPSKRKLFSKGDVIIEKNVWIGEGAVILPNVVIGENSIIGANSVVTKSIPKNSVVGGAPAKILKNL